MKDNATIVLNSQKNERAKFLISDEAGRWVSIQTFDLEVGVNTLQLEVSTLAAGVYFLSLERNKRAEAVRFVVED